jgi:predicted transcriptional regulator
MEEIDSRLIEGLSELMVKEPSSLEVMLMLTDKGPMTIEEISNEIIYDTKITDLLNKLKRFKVVGFINNLVYITSYGQYLVKKMRSQLPPPKGGGLSVMTRATVD